MTAAPKKAGKQKAPAGGGTMRAARERFHWTQAEAARALGLSVQQIAAIEQGRSGMTRPTLLLLAAYEDRTGPNGWTPRPFDPWQPPAPLLDLLTEAD